MARHGWTSPAGLEQRPGAADVALERRNGIPVGHADDGLRRQVEHRVDLVLAEYALDQRLVADVATHSGDSAEEPAAHELTLRHPVTQETDDLRPGAHEGPGEPAAE